MNLSLIALSVCISSVESCESKLVFLFLLVLCWPGIMKEMIDEKIKLNSR